MLDLAWTKYLLIGLGCVSIGINKTALPGIGIIAVLLMAEVFPARSSTGFLLPMLVFADIFAVVYYRRSAEWRHILRLVPWALIGIGIGYLVLRVLDDQQMRPVIGGIALCLLTINFLRSIRKNSEQKIPKGIWFPAVMGVLAGITTMIANASGPIMVIYLLAMGLPKKAFVGTAAWYYLLLNLVKIPFSVSLGLITFSSFTLNLMYIPVIVAGAFLGILLIKKLPQKVFLIVIQVIAAGGAVKLFF